mmetsp:Transcript_32150/g.42854  ORF Transcript_32150/g.42854 Transcript_32150/m.42854 type:complete len:368 (+) Transcript_32150:153-1256(+)
MRQEKQKKEARQYYLKRENKIANDAQHFIIHPRVPPPPSTHRLPPSPSPHQLIKYVKKESCNPHPKKEKCCNQTWKRISFPVIILLCCGVGLAIGSIIWKQRQSSKKRNTDTTFNHHGGDDDDTSAILQDNNEQTQERYKQLSSLIETYGMTSLHGNTTHQNLALLWISQYDDSIAVADVLQLIEKDNEDEEEEDSNHHDQIQSFLERYALIVFYFSTNRVITQTSATTAVLTQPQTKWTHNENWMATFDSICTWYGVTCKNLDNDGNDGHNNVFQQDSVKVVTSLDLSLNNLEGTMPSEINLLTHLSILNLSNNALEGRIPVDLSGLGLLETLNLEGNNLNGSIPDIFCDNGASILVDVDIECNCC